MRYYSRKYARAKTEKTLTMEQVCTEAVTRGGSDLNFDTMLEAVKAYFDEAFYQLADGFSVENDYFSLHPKIGGTFEHPDEGVDPKKIAPLFQRPLAIILIKCYYKIINIF